MKPDKTVDTVLLNSDESFSYSAGGNECMNGTETPFCFVGVKLENTDNNEK